MNPSYIATQIIKRVRSGRGKVAVFLQDTEHLRMVPASQCNDWKNRVTDKTFVGIYDKSASLSMVASDVEYQLDLLK